MISHLSSEQLDSALQGRPTYDVSRHLERCGSCAEELASLGGTLADLRSSADAFATQQKPFAAVTSPLKLPRFVWALGAAALAVSFATPLALTHRDHVPVAVDSEIPAVTVAVSDEALLDSVQSDLSSSVPDSMLPLAGTSTAAADSTTAQNTPQRKYE